MPDLKDFKPVAVAAAIFALMRYMFADFQQHVIDNHAWIKDSDLPTLYWGLSIMLAAAVFGLWAYPDQSGISAPTGEQRTAMGIHKVYFLFGGAVSLMALFGLMPIKH